MPRLKFDLQPVGPWPGETVDEHNAYMREAYGDKEWAKHDLAPCSCGYHPADMLCTCGPQNRTAEVGRRHLERHYREKHQKALRAKREFPGPPCDGKGTGWCRWCGTEIINPKTGRRHAQRTWCPDGGCLRLFNLHTFHVAQRRYLKTRDGEGCRQCRAPYTEVDHFIPLGAAWEAFPEPERRRWFFSPANLQLLCIGKGGCHVAKSRDDVALIKACQRNGPEWAKGEILNRLAAAGRLKSTGTSAP